MQRWDVERQAELSGGPAIGFGAYLACEPSRFDPVAFRLSGSEAVLVDPQQRLLLECSAEAFVSADGYVPHKRHCHAPLRPSCKQAVLRVYNMRLMMPGHTYMLLVQHYLPELDHVRVGNLAFIKG